MPPVKRAILVLAIVVAAAGALAIRVVTEGRAALADGDAWMQRGRPADAIRAYETAARWYLPLAPHVDDAYAKLRTLAESRPAGAAGDGAIQLAAWRAIRSAARSTRWLTTPHADDLAAADAAIARISASVPQAGTADVAWHAARLAHDGRPGIGLALLASAGILLWLGGAFVLVRRGITSTGTLVRRVAAPAGLAMIAGLACWAVGLYNG